MNLMDYGIMIYDKLIGIIDEYKTKIKYISVK